MFQQVMSKICCCFSRSDASYVGRMYLILKMLEVTVAVGVLFVMNLWLDGFHVYGARVLISAFEGNYNTVKITSKYIRSRL